MTFYRGQVCVWAPDPDSRAQLTEILGSLRAPVVFVDELEAAVAETGADAGSVLLATLDAPHHRRLFAALGQADSRERTILLARRPDFDQRLAAIRAGIRHLFTVPLDGERLRQCIEGLLQTVEERPYRILLVGDDRLISAYHRALLEAAGHEVLPADSGATALARARDDDPDLILLDFFLGDCSGPELVSILRSDDSLAHHQVLFLSARGAADLERDVLTALGEEYLTKPVQPESFVALVGARAARSRRARTLNADLRLAQRLNRNLRLAMDAHAIVSITDPGGRLVYVNDKFCSTNGYRAEELLGKGVDIVRSGIHSEAYYHNMWETLVAGRIWQGEICNRQRNGELYWVQSTLVPCLGDDGKPQLYVSVSTDITVQKEVEERLVALLNTANVGLAWADPAGRFQDCNATFAAMLGYTTAELLTLGFADVTYPDDLKGSLQQIGELAAGTPNIRTQRRYRRRDGEIIWGDLMLSRIDRQNGELGGLVAAVIDITPQKRAEDRLQLVVRGSLDGIWDWDRTQHSVYYSARFRELLGFAEDQEALFLRYFHLRRVVHPEDRRRVVAALVDHIRKGASALFDVEVRFLHRDGSYRWFRARGKALWDEGGRPLRFAGSFTDFSALKQADQDLRQARDAAEAASRAKSDFLSRMTHELRTPLNAVLGFAQLLHSDPVDRPTSSQRASIEQIQKAGWHLLDLINEVLDLSSIEAGNVDVVLGEVNLQTVIGECIGLVSLLAARHGISVNHHAGHLGPCLVRADSRRLKQVVLNLLSNAVKYNRAGGSIAVDIGATAEGWRIDVHDTGIGMSADQIAGLFQPFTRFAEDGAIEGTGIGLAITRRLVEAMGARIAVLSEPGVGSTFSVSLAGVSDHRSLGEPGRQTAGLNIAQQNPC